MNNDEYRRLTDVIGMEEGEKAVAEEGPSNAEPESAGTDDGHHHDEVSETEPEKAESVPADEPKPEEEPDGQGGETVAKKPGTHTKDEQRKYAWRELTRKNSELKRRIRELEEANRRFQESTSKPLKEEDFKDQTEFRNASIEQMLDMRDMKRNSEAMGKLRDELSESEAQELDYRARENVETLFPTEEARQEYSKAVSTAAQYGFGRFLDETPEGREITDFCNNSPMGAAIIYHLAKHPNDFVVLMKDPSQQRRLSRLAILEDNIGRLYSKKGKPSATEEKPKDAAPEKKPLPRMGALKNTSPAGAVDDDDAIAFIRKYG